MTDLDGTAFKRVGNTLIPCDVMADEMLASLKNGERYLIKIAKPRSIDQHRFFFAILRAVVDATDRWVDENALLEALKVAVGHTYPVRLFGGTVVEVPASISFASMAGDRFRVFFDKSMAVLSETTGIDPMVLIEQADDIAPRPKALEDWKQPWQK